ncbi:GTP-binding protein LepA [Levilactobacillus koreensis JCM 16448]|uniref:Elongation factor 4 n=1 Tax=Levilactobacillus koreensis TaxID=637971 RepID=A0AAC8UVD3_9LACO|nr:translation elongation factor 4 [Levilactobacillus koreensis]AKP64297.1 elongation factor 4 [Levilactobacillus koreensis]KRK91088.1 GTP-binding protein LepA [Levilactobacillus koreensis JCM 16448]
MTQKNTRNFAIIAHIDHGKSTLADRIMEQTQTVSDRDSKAQLLDDLQVEQAHGVTVKSRTVRNYYHADDGQEYTYNFIDTPGHVDFTYEVSKSLAASDGALLLVDATQGVQAQTVANLRLARDNHLVVIPVINKIDAAAADVDRTAEQIRALAPEFATVEILKISAKTGLNVHDVLEAIHTRIPAPVGDVKQPLKALVFDSQYDAFKGIIAYVRVVDGKLTTADKLTLMANNQTVAANEIGIFAPQRVATKQLSAGDVGYVVTGLKDPQALRVGDTLTSATTPTATALPGYQPSQSMVFAGFYPQGDHYHDLQLAVEKLALNDTSFHYHAESSDALGAGFRCGFLGIFHLQIIRERLHDEYGLDVLTTAPNVTYRVHLKNEDEPVIVNNPIAFPDYAKIDFVEEPLAEATITTTSESLSDVMKLATQHKGELQDMRNQGDLVVLVYQLPFAEIAYDFFNALKSVSHGYATLTTELSGYDIADVVKIEVHVNYAKVDALSFVVHREDAPKVAQELVHKLKFVIPRKLYPMPVQSVVEGKALARVDVPPLRKNAAANGEKKSTSKKQALLRRQSVNKRQAAHSDIELPQEVFNAVLDLEK